MNCSSDYGLTNFDHANTFAQGAPLYVGGYYGTGDNYEDQVRTVMYGVRPDDDEPHVVAVERTWAAMPKKAAMAFVDRRPMHAIWHPDEWRGADVLLAGVCDCGQVTIHRDDDGLPRHLDCRS